MSHKDYTAEILGMEDIEVEKVTHTEKEIRIQFHKKRCPQICPVCGSTTERVHDYHMTVLRDIPILGVPTRLAYRKRRYVCNHCCKRFSESSPLAGKHQRTTRRLALFCLELAKERRSQKSVAVEMGVSASSVSRWWKYIPCSKPSKLPRVLSIDEYKGDAGGERFQCILTAPETRTVLDILPDRTASTIQSYLKTFSGRDEVEYFVMDMNRAYRDIARTFFPKAKIVIDRFYFVRYGVWAFENVRRRVQQSLPPAKRKYFKRSRKLLLCRADRLSIEERQSVDVMLAHSEDLTRAWLLKEAFFVFVDAKSSASAKEALDHFRFFAKSLAIPEFAPCLKVLRNWEPYILNAFECPFSNGFTEGVNNATKALKRATFGMPNFQNARARILFSFS